MVFILGVMVGIGLCTFLLVVHQRFEAPLRQKLEQTQSLLKTKGAIIEPEAEELQAWIEDIKI